MAVADHKALESEGVRYIGGGLDHAVAFSICSLVASDENYARLVKSFRAHGFTKENSEFIAGDNRRENQFDGFTWTRRLYPECRGKYIIFCHDDVELVDDGYDKLLRRLDELTEADPSWLLAGNAGGRYRESERSGTTARLAQSLTDYRGTFRQTEPYLQVESLDENFIVMRRDLFVAPSIDGTGFHFYGSDLCMIAEMLGGTCYVIDFHLNHHGDGIAGWPYELAKLWLAAKYGQYFPGRVVRTTTGSVTLGHPT